MSVYSGHYKDILDILKDVNAGKVIIDWPSTTNLSWGTQVKKFNPSTFKKTAYSGKKAELVLEMLDEGYFYAAKEINNTKLPDWDDKYFVGYLAKLTTYGKETLAALPILMKQSK